MERDFGCRESLETAVPGIALTWHPFYQTFGPVGERCKINTVYGHEYTVLFMFGRVAPCQSIIQGKNSGQPWKPVTIIHCAHLNEKDIFSRVQCWLQMFCSVLNMLLQLLTCFCFSQTLSVEYNSPCLQSLIYTAWDGRCYLLLAAMLLCFTKEAGYRAPTFSFLSVYISPFLSPVHRQAVSAEAGTMSTPTNPEVKELSPVDFIQLQQYIECEYRQGGGRAGGQLSQRLTPPLSTSTSTHTHSFTLAHGFSYLEEVAVCQLVKHAYLLCFCG